MHVMVFGPFFPDLWPCPHSSNEGGYILGELWENLFFYHVSSYLVCLIVVFDPGVRFEFGNADVEYKVVALSLCRIRVSMCCRRSLWE
jgi:hypothetical protein